MRLHSLLALAAAGTLLLPLAASAGTLPDGKKGPYMDQCVQAATAQGVDAKVAYNHCKCSADAVEKNFTSQEILQLDSKNGIDANLKAKAERVVREACVPKS